MRNGSERIWWGNEARAGPLKVEGCVPARIPMTESAPNKALVAPREARDLGIG
jgi:hypothetical protein